MADEDVIEDVPSFDPSMKKKKKKKKAFTEDDDQATPVDDAQTAPADGADAADAADGQDEEAELDFSNRKKKKKKATSAPAEEASADDSAADSDNKAAADDEDGEVQSDDDEDGDPSERWLGTDRDYTYDELLSRAFSILDGNNPDSSRSKRNRMVMKPPSVFREGTKRTVWANFQEICKLMHRSTDHVMAFSLTELGTSGSVDGSFRLVIKGRFTPKQIESVIKHYITEYVTCRTCKSPETNLKKENRLYFVQCRSCGSTRSVAAIKYGFQAQVGKRKKV